MAEPDRRDWLDAQLIALATQARALAGDELPYSSTSVAASRSSPSGATTRSSKSAALELEALLPGADPLAERLAAWDGRFEIPVERL